MAVIGFAPAPGFILVEVTQTKNDVILVADEEGTPSNIGIVVKVGKETIHQSGQVYGVDVKKGDSIVFKPYGIEKIYLNGKEHNIISFDNLRGVLNEKK